MLTGVQAIRGWTRSVPASAWVLIALALVIRLAFIAATPDYRPKHDDRDYDRLACALVTGDGYPRESPRAPAGDDCRRAAPSAEPTAFRPPGFPMFLAGIYTVARPLGIDRWTAARVAQAVLGALAAALIGLIALRLWGRTTALVAIALAAVYPPLILIGGSLLTEPLFVALVLGTLAAVLAYRADPRRSLLIGAGVLAGLTALTRTNGVLLLLPLALLVFGAGAAAAARRTRAGHAAVFVAIALVTVAPWTIRNAVALHSFVPVSTEAGSALAGTYNDAARTNPVRPGAWVVPGTVPELRRLVASDFRDEPAAEGRQLSYAFDYMKGRPGYVAEVAGRNTLRLLNLDGKYWWRFSAGTISQVQWGADIAGYAFFPFILLALAGAFLPAARRAPAWMWLVPGLLFLSVVPLVGELRMRAPIEPFILLLAALPVAALIERRRASR
ncbi:MAG: hypothetical protein QOJ07_1316 [Thermoleophilaceae bacterium]|nr:hypothetical protein [Thermoleophilaceae bacterium]